MTDQKKALRYAQPEVNYLPLSNVDGKACASCRWFNSWGGGECQIINNWPLDVLATGVCDKHDPLPMPAPADEVAIETAIDAVTTAIETVTASASLDEPEPTPVIPATGSKLLDRLKSLFSRTDDDPFQVFKGSNGHHYWLARHTNMFEDREQEILSSAAHKDYVARVAAGLVDPPELWSFHAKGTRHGQADIVWEHAGFVFALGHFDDTPAAKKAIKAYQKRKGKIELSHGFVYPRWALKDGVYTSYNTFEITTLPVGAAANPYTTFDEVMTMALSKTQQDWIKSTLGDEGLNAALAAQEAAEKDAEGLKTLGAKFKDFANLSPEAAAEAVKGLDLAKSYGKVLGSLIIAQAEQGEQLEAARSAQTAAEKALADERTANAAAIKALQDDVALLKVNAGARPRRATDGTNLTVDKDKAPSDIHDGVVEPEDFFGVPLKPK